MDPNVVLKDFKNRGGYKRKVTNNNLSAIDSYSVRNMENHINRITDTLFLGLSRGMRFPAMFTGEVYYNETSDAWDFKNILNQGYGFIQSVSSYKSGSDIEYLTVVTNSKILGKTDTTPLVFVYNKSTTNDYDNDYVLFPRVSNIDGGTVTIALEANNAGTWGYYQSANNGEVGLSIGIDFLVQSSSESEDNNFYTPGIPDWTYDSYTRTDTILFIHGYVYNTIMETSEVIDWECKVKGRAIKWLGDCTTGYADPAGSYIYATDPIWTTGLHTLRFESLYQDSRYKIWIQIDSKVGQNRLEWQEVGCFTTESSGDPDLPGQT